MGYTIKTTTGKAAPIRVTHGKDNSPMKQITEQESKFIKARDKAVKGSNEAGQKEESYATIDGEKGSFSIPEKDPLNTPEARKAQSDRVKKGQANPKKYKKVKKNPKTGGYTEGDNPEKRKRELDAVGRVISKSDDTERVTYNTDGSVKSIKHRMSDGSWQ